MFELMAKIEIRGWAAAAIRSKSLSDVSLLDILEATGEHLDCNHPTTEEFHMRYGKAAQKLGIVNYITREYLKEIKLFEL